MQTLTSISEILQDELYISTITPDTSEVEISIGDFLITGDLEFQGYVIPRDWDCNVPASFEITRQSLYPTLFDEEGEEIELSKSDKDVINAWFQTIKLHVEL